MAGYKLGNIKGPRGERGPQGIPGKTDEATQAILDTIAGEILQLSADFATYKADTEAQILELSDRSGKWQEPQ